MTEAEIIGSIGVAMLLVAFFLNLAGRLKANSYPYVLLNLAGASLSCLSSWLIEFLPFVILEGTWATVAAGGLVRLLWFPRQTV
ncbi:MAG: hypothetical protein R3F55_08310 [Alphaproteobacteria bacterium]